MDSKMKPGRRGSTGNTNPVRVTRSSAIFEDVAPHQVRAARGLLGWTAARLAQRAVVDLDALIAFESDGYFLSAIAFSSVQEALRQAGVVFIAPSDGRGRGVRLAEPPSGGTITFKGPPKRKRPWA